MFLGFSTHFWWLAWVDFNVFGVFDPLWAACLGWF
jgi:hypothetical protein